MSAQPHVGDVSQGESYRSRGISTLIWFRRLFLVGPDASEWVEAREYPGVPDERSGRLESSFPTRRLGIREERIEVPARNTKAGVYQLSQVFRKRLYQICNPNCPNFDAAENLPRN